MFSLSDVLYLITALRSVKPKLNFYVWPHLKLIISFLIFALRFSSSEQECASHGHDSCSECSSTGTNGYLGCCFNSCKSGSESLRVLGLVEENASAARTNGQGITNGARGGTEVEILQLITCLKLALHMAVDRYALEWVKRLPIVSILWIRVVGWNAPAF